MTPHDPDTCELPVRECPLCMRIWLDRPSPPGDWRVLLAEREAESKRVEPLDLGLKKELVNGK